MSEEARGKREGGRGLRDGRGAAPGVLLTENGYVGRGKREGGAGQEQW